MRMQLQAPAFRSRGKTSSTRPRPSAPPARRPHPEVDRKAAAVRLAAGAVVLWGLMCLLGLLMTHVLSSGPVHTADLGVDKWLAARRTGPWNDITAVGTGLAQTPTAIAVTAAVVLLLRWRLGRWYESLVMITVMVGELVIFFCVTKIIDRPRPSVHHLDAAPPTSSFPSGHTGAAVALYGGITILMLWLYGHRPATRAIAVVLAFLPVLVGFSRLYRGMHYPSDVIAGALLGGTWLTLVIATLLPERTTARGRATVRRRGAVHQR
jgi:membrane-associated phospholipid phosphatase